MPYGVKSGNDPTSNALRAAGFGRRVNVPRELGGCQVRSNAVAPSASFGTSVVRHLGTSAVSRWIPQPFPCPTCPTIVPPQAFRGHALSPDAIMPAADLELLQGTLDLLILKTLSWGPRHGYSVASWIRQTTDDRLQIEEGALSTALHRMEKRGWLESEWGISDNNRKAKYYQLTAQGRKQLRAKTTVWTEYAGAVFKVLQTA